MLGYFGLTMRDSGSPLTKQILEGKGGKGKEGGRRNSDTAISENELR